MKSVFTFRSLFPVISVPVLVFCLGIYVHWATTSPANPPPLRGIPLAVLLTFTIAWLFFGEFRTKMIKVELGDEAVTIYRFGGLGPAKVFRYSDLDGFKLSTLISASGDNEYLYFMQSGKKVGKISNLYHKNYKELKAMTRTRLKDLGFEKFSLIDELRESFS